MCWIFCHVSWSCALERPVNTFVTVRRDTHFKQMKTLLSAVA